MDDRTISFDPNDARNIEADLGCVIQYLTSGGGNSAQMLQELRAGLQYMKAPQAKVRLLEELLAEPLKQIPDDAPQVVRDVAKNVLSWFYEFTGQSLTGQ